MLEDREFIAPKDIQRVEEVTTVVNSNDSSRLLLLFTATTSVRGSKAKQLAGFKAGFHRACVIAHQDQVKIRRKGQVTPHPTMFSYVCRFPCGSKRKKAPIIVDDVFSPPFKRANVHPLTKESTYLSCTSVCTPYVMNSQGIVSSDLSEPTTELRVQS